MDIKQLVQQVRYASARSVNTIMTVTYWEIGPLYKGQGLKARESYVKGISTVLQNSRKFLSKNFDIFLVANDKYKLYPSIAEQSGMKIVNQFKRPVLNRTERNKNPYSEFIFHLKDKS